MKASEVNRSLFIPVLMYWISFPAFTQTELRAYDQSVPGTSVTFRMMPVPGGKFRMGSPVTESGREADEAQEDRELSPFWMSESEVTFAEWDAYFKDSSLPQSKVIDGVTRATPQYIDLTWGMGRDGRHPTNSMSQLAAVMYCKWLYAKTGVFYRLPTEAEWEYACKKGKTGAKGLDAAAWFRDNSGGKFHKIKGKEPNVLGIYDMLGNLSEWTLDQYDASGYASLSMKDPLAAPGTRYPRVVRGGSWQDEARELRCSNRLASNALWNQRDPQVPKSKWWLTDGMFVGIRLVRPMKQPADSEILAFYDQYLR